MVARPQGLFFEREDAEQVAAALQAQGYAVEVRRANFHGEDDDEDQPWSVITEAPDVVLELLVEEHQGWLDFPDRSTPSLGGALPLPLAPVRIKREPPV